MEQEAGPVSARTTGFRSLVTTRRLFGLFWRETPVVTAALTVVLLLRGAVPALEIVVLGRFVDQAKELVEGTAGPEPAAVLLAKFLGLMAACTWLQLLRDTLEDYLRDRLGATLEQRVLARAATLELSFFEQEETYDQLQRARDALDVRFAQVLTSSLTSVQHAFTIAALFAVLAVAHPLLGPVIVAAALPVFWFKLVRTQHQFSFAFESTPLRRRISYFIRLGSERRYAKQLQRVPVGRRRPRAPSVVTITLQEGRPAVPYS